MTSQPAGVSIGDPQLPIWTSSQGWTGTWIALAVVPEPDVVGPQQVGVLVVDPTEGGVAPTDRSREQGQALVACGRAVERGDPEGREVLRLDELGQDVEPVVGGVGGVVARGGDPGRSKRTNRASSMPRLSDGPGREDHALGQRGPRVEGELVVGGRQPVDRRAGVLAVLRPGRPRRGPRRAQPPARPS